jgi:thioredoxin reductase
MTAGTFSFDGAEVPVTPGASLAAALTEAGVRAFRETEGGARRGIFCGMGVCQDCLVTVDGQPNRRACMTEARPGMIVAPQTARPPLAAPPAARLSAERLSPDILVVGGGAGGLSAAVAARREEAGVLVLDERKVAGGQYFKQTAADAAPMDRQQEEGRALVAAAEESGARILRGVEVWGAFDGTTGAGPEVMASSGDKVYAIRPSAVIVATGAYERPTMIPGWTLPGVMTVGAAQTLWRSYRTLPGKRVAIFGNGPLAAQVGLELARGGAEIVLLGEAGADPLRRAGAVAAMARHDPRLAFKGAEMLTALLARGIRVRHDALPERIEAEDGALAVTYRKGGREGRVVADAVCLNFGFQPQNEILRLLGARMAFDLRFGQLRPERGETMETSVPGLYAVGDCCGLGGAPAAALEGTIAGRAAAGGPGPRFAERSELARHRRFQAALWRLYEAPAPRLADASPDTVVCRCEEVTKGTLDAALAGGAQEIGAVKRATRIGMGRCQGRYCAPALAAYLSEREGRVPEDLSFFAPRVPIKPVDIGTLVAAEPLLETAGGDG